MSTARSFSCASGTHSWTAVSSAAPRVSANTRSSRDAVIGSGVVGDEQPAVLLDDRSHGRVRGQFPQRGEQTGILDVIRSSARYGGGEEVRHLLGPVPVGQR